MWLAWHVMAAAVQVSEPNEAAVCRSMASGARAALAAYPTSLDEDEAALAAATSATSASSPGTYCDSTVVHLPHACLKLPKR